MSRRLETIQSLAIAVRPIGSAGARLGMGRKIEECAAGAGCAAGRRCESRGAADRTPEMSGGEVLRWRDDREERSRRDA